MIEWTNRDAEASNTQEVSFHASDREDQSPLPVDQVNVLMEQGLAAFQQGHHAEAIACFERVITLAPDLFDAYFYLATSLSTLGRLEEAIEAMKRARAIRPDSTAVYYNLGLLCRRAGRSHEAREYLEEGLQRVRADSRLDDPKQMKRNLKKALSELRRWRFF